MPAMPRRPPSALEAPDTPDTVDAAVVNRRVASRTGLGRSLQSPGRAVRNAADPGIRTRRDWNALAPFLAVLTVLLGQPVGFRSTLSAPGRPGPAGPCFETTLGHRSGCTIRSMPMVPVTASIRRPGWRSGGRSRVSFLSGVFRLICWPRRGRVVPSVPVGSGTVARVSGPAGCCRVMGASRPWSRRQFSLLS